MYVHTYMYMYAFFIAHTCVHECLPVSVHLMHVHTRIQNHIRSCGYVHTETSVSTVSVVATCIYVVPCRRVDSPPPMVWPPPQP